LEAAPACVDQPNGWNQPFIHLAPDLSCEEIHVRKLSEATFILFAVTLSASTTTVSVNDERGGVGDSLINAEAIVAVQILDTDYTATAADGPMYAHAKVLKAVKGRLSDESKLRFGESAWCGPSYKPGEFRVLFLKRVESGDNYFRSSPWASLCSFSRGIDFFFLADKKEVLSLASLKSFLREVQDAQSVPPGISVRVDQRDNASLDLFLTLSNQSTQEFWLNQSRVTASYDANNKRYIRNVEFADVKDGEWVKILPSRNVTGTVRIALEEVKGVHDIALLVSHTCVCFPKRCWTGAVKFAPIRLTKH